MKKNTKTPPRESEKGKIKNSIRTHRAIKWILRAIGALAGVAIFSLFNWLGAPIGQSI